ncbi:MAPK/MAK/MRK overlapping kinase [Suricata suricatta]|uniref:MAPK/MAK/MRK overlapping kinase n=1 Tax=Suricata suricatta TaxID=37032 RepID=UPI001155C804|nr:MAPK/MAK/MRK overlapping kinase [Suricata suricatta]
MAVQGLHGAPRRSRVGVSVGAGRLHTGPLGQGGPGPTPPVHSPSSPGADELDQISKIHDVISTPAEKTLTKFKWIRIPLLTASLSSRCLPPHDPDDRIAAHHASFQGQRTRPGSERRTFARDQRPPA